MSLRPALLSMAALGCGASQAAGLYLPAGDQSLRNDLQLLVDERVMQLPMMAWPLSRPAVEDALAAASEPGWDQPWIHVAFERVRERLRRPEQLHVAVVTIAGQPGIARDFEVQGREEATLNVQAHYVTDDVGFVASLSAVSSASDAQTLRGDGSELTLRLGDWLLGVNALDRWWGPGQQSSLILSNNARPIPALMLERASGNASGSHWLSWFGPWRLTVLAGLMDDDRADVQRPLFLGLRAEAMPLPWLDVAIERTAQTCGSARRCTAGSLSDAVLGDELLSGVDIGADPAHSGDTLAGAEVRAASPWRELPAALYLQLIGADAAGGLPHGVMGLIGAEYWYVRDSGATLRIDAEYSDSSCAFYRSLQGGRPAHFDCAYNSRPGDVEGYRYLGRALGAWTDNDARLASVTLRYARIQDDEWSVKWLLGRLNRDDETPDVRNTLAAVRTGYRAMELGWSGVLAGQATHIQVGLQQLAPWQQATTLEPYGFVGWGRVL